MTSSRRVYTRDSILSLRHSPSIPALPRSVRRTLWWHQLLRPCVGKIDRPAHPDNLGTSHRATLPDDASNTSDLPGGAGDREAPKDRAPAATNRPFRIATFNCRTLKAPWRRGLLAQLAADLQIDILMLQEHSIVSDPGLQNEDLGGGWTFRYTTADRQGRGGVGVLISPRLNRSLCCVSLTPRLLRIDLRLRRRNVRLFCAYAPTAVHPEEAYDFFDLLSGHVDATARRNPIVILGDLNAVMPKSDNAPFATSQLNANSDHLLSLVDQHDLFSANTVFRKPRSRLITFIGCKRPRQKAHGPNAKRRLAQLDHILLRTRDRHRVLNCDTVRPLAIRSDHKLLLCDLRFRDPLYRPPKRHPRRNFSALKDSDVQRRFVKVFDSTLQPNPCYSSICSAIHTAAERSLPLIRKKEGAQPIWMTDPVVRRAGLRLENLRKRGRNTEKAERELATVYREQQLTAISDAIKSVDSVPPEKKNSAVWEAINTLTGRKRRTALSLSGDTPDVRKSEVRAFFANVLNAPPPPLPDRLQLPPGTPLPDSSCFDTGPVSPSEVVALAKLSPGGKATGPDDVPLEALRIPSVAKEVACIINQVLADGAAPPEWTLAHIVAVPKKPGTTKVEEHRGISMLSCAAKLFNRLLLKRLLSVIDPFLRPEQNGFRPRRGTVTQILSLRRIIEETKIRQADLVCVFVDFHKAFDSVARGALPLVLRAYNVPEKLVTAVMALYHNTYAAVITPDGLTDPFSTTSGVLQGDTLAPFLFVLVLDWVLRTSLPSNDDGFQLCRRTSSRHLEKRLAFLAYADDLALLASDANGAQRQLDALATVASRVGLAINARKTQVLTVPASLPAEIKLHSPNRATVTLSRSDQFRYLGGCVPNVREDLLHRRALAWAAFRSVRTFL